MTPIARARQRFERLKPEQCADLMAHLCIGLTGGAREALASAEPDVTGARAFIDLLQEAQKVLPPPWMTGSQGLSDAGVESVGTLFMLAEALKIAPRFEAMWNEAWTLARSSALGPGANSNGPALAGITDRAKAQIAACRSRWPIPAGASGIPLICIDHGPNFAGMFHDREEVEDDIAATDGIELVLTLENDDEPPRGRTIGLRR